MRFTHAEPVMKNAKKFTEPEPTARAEKANKSIKLAKSEASDSELDAIRLYLKEIGIPELLTPEEEVKYARAALRGDEASRHRMIEGNLRLVVKIARRYLYRGMALLDLIEEGNLGLMHAVEKFDPERGFRFSTYATWWIRQTIERSIMNQNRTIRLPIHVIREVNAVLRESQRQRQSLGRRPSHDEIAAALDISCDDVERAYKLYERTISIDAPLAQGSEQTLIDAIADDSVSDPATETEAASTSEALGHWMEQLSEKQRWVLERRFGLNGHEIETLEVVGEGIGLTRERVRQIQVDALKRLRTILDAENLTTQALFEK